MTFHQIRPGSFIRFQSRVNGLIKFGIFQEKYGAEDKKRWGYNKIFAAMYILR